MIRTTGLALAAILMTVGQAARAQMPTYHGGFGMAYTQPIPANTAVPDRWWTMQATPTVGSTMPYPSVGYNPYAQMPAAPRRVLRGRRNNRVIRGASRYAAAPAAETYALPTGSLYWPAQPGTPIYSPAQRYAAYGQGYALSPYGTTDYGSMYKGYAWGR